MTLLCIKTVRGSNLVLFHLLQISFRRKRTRSSISMLILKDPSSYLAKMQDPDALILHDSSKILQDNRSTLCIPQLQSTCHYIIIHYVKIWHVILGGGCKLNAPTKLWGGGGVQTDKIPKHNRLTSGELLSNDRRAVGLVSS